MININLIQGNCLEKLKNIPNESIEAIVCDPPYELNLMNKKWDNTGIAYNIDLWKECFRVLKPGGHLTAFGGTRTYHRMAVAIEDAGFEVRDMLEWIYASGFPKNLDVGKAVDKLCGNERTNLGAVRGCGNNNTESMNSGVKKSSEFKPTYTLTKGSSEWEGFGTALKPAHEPIILCRKPLSEKNIAKNVLKHGTGAIDIDGCRIPTNDLTPRNNRESATWGTYGNGYAAPSPHGRFPANIICTDDALNDHGSTVESKSRYFDIDVWAEKHGLLQFPKASKKERNEGCDGLEKKNLAGSNKWTDVDYRKGDGKITAQPQHNHHPTVKPIHLISWLIRLISKKGGTVLDPFMGSGTTGVACVNLDRNFIGIELNTDYFKIAEKRINAARLDT